MRRASLRYRGFDSYTGSWMCPSDCVCSEERDQKWLLVHATMLVMSPESSSQVDEVILYTLKRLRERNSNCEYHFEFSKPSHN